jgi:hypothetical protein
VALIVDRMPSLSEPLRCYRCGASLARLTLPLARLDECPSCAVHLHVCRMCVRYAPSKPKQCTEEDALEVRDKRSANFCDYFSPSATAFAGEDLAAERRSREQLEALFGTADKAPAAGAERGGDEMQRAASSRGNQAGAAATEAARDEPDAGGLSPAERARQQAEALFKK